MLHGRKAILEFLIRRAAVSVFQLLPPPAPKQRKGAINHQENARYGTVCPSPAIVSSRYYRHTTHRPPGNRQSAACGQLSPTSQAPPTKPPLCWPLMSCRFSRPHPRSWSTILFGRTTWPSAMSCGPNLPPSHLMIVALRILLEDEMASMAQPHSDGASTRGVGPEPGSPPGGRGSEL